MARKKNSENSPALTLGTTEDTQIINSADLEAKEAELLNDSEEIKEPKEVQKEKEKEVTTSEVPAPEATAAKPKRQRKPRKPAAVEITANDATTPNLDLSKEVTIAKETVEVTMNTLVAQFNTIKEISTHINTQLEKMNSLVKEMSPNQSSNLEELLKPQTNSQFITKFATAASLAAILVSFLSMSMSQSARQTVISATLKNNESNSVQVSSNKEGSNEIAFTNRETPSKKSNFVTNIKGLVPFKNKK
ncbi:MAG: hypothetical protein EBR01_08920 [Proteobacteria bacterium]|nr:hypothetical protein [Pseudomonadota bacterium]